MKNIYLVFGYGVPKNILKDENYNFYLKIAFNRIFDDVAQNTIHKPLIIFSGGKTDMFKPYMRTEADEMFRLIKKLSSRKSVQNKTKDWEFIAERRAISTLENFLESIKILRSRRITSARITIFCEQTRKKRIVKLAKKLFSKNYNFRVDPIDFDVSSNRYLDPKLIKRKEHVAIKHALWALRTPENLNKHHKFFIKKLIFLRKQGAKGHVKAVERFWKIKLKELEKNELAQIT